MPPAAGRHICRMRPRKRCPYCRCLFQPDPRVSTRQWACRKTSCQAERRRETQRRYRAAHPDDPAARQLRAALAAAKAGRSVKTPQGPPAAVGRFPWDELRDEISPQQLVIVSFFVRLVFRSGRDAISSEVSRIAEQFSNYAAPPAKDAMGPKAAPS